MKIKKKTKRDKMLFVQWKRVTKATNCSKKKIKCYKCGKDGHIATNCNRNLNNNNIKTVVNNIDVRKIEIQGKKIEAIFDTGASESMICTGLLKELKNIEIEPIEKIYKNFDGTCNKTKGVVNLRFKYRGKNILEKFNVVENKRIKQF